MIRPQLVHIPDKPYLTKKLEPKALQNVLGSSIFTVDSLYCIANSAISKFDIVDETVDGLKFLLYVKVEWAYAEDARRQVQNIKGWRSLIRKKPRWTVRAKIETTSYQIKYLFEHRLSNVNHVYQQLDEQVQFFNHWIETKNA